MSESIQDLRKKLGEIEKSVSGLFAEAKQEFPDTVESHYGPVGSELLDTISFEVLEKGNTLGRDVRILVAQVSSILRAAPLISESDLKELSRLGKTMVAALRFHEYAEWGPQILHDEGVVLGVSPAGRDETPLRSVESARLQFEGAYRSVAEMMDYWSPSVMLPEELAASSTGSRGSGSYRPNSAFILMWISDDNPELADVRDAVQEVFQSYDVDAVRADDIEHEGVITEQIIQQIKSSEFLFADLSGERPSVYYEVGYAHAIGKRVILFRKKGTRIHFDLAAYNCPEYENLGDLKRKLTKRLGALTNKANASELA